MSSVTISLPVYLGPKIRRIYQTDVTNFSIFPPSVCSFFHTYALMPRDWHWFFFFFFNKHISALAQQQFSNISDKGRRHFKSLQVALYQEWRELKKWFGYGWALFHPPWFIKIIICACLPIMLECQILVTICTIISWSIFMHWES